MKELPEVDRPVDDEDREPLVNPNWKKRFKKKSKKAGKRAKLVVVGLVIGVVAGAFGMWEWQNYHPQTTYENPAADEKWTPTISTVFEEIRSEDELVGASQKYCIVRKYGDSNSFFGLFDLPFTENSMWYRYAGTLKAGVDLSRATYTLDGTTIRIQLYEPYIVSNTPDMELTGVLEERNNILNPIHVSDVDDLQRACIEESQSEFWNDDLISECKANIERDIEGMYTAALGDEYTVAITWVEDD